MHTVLEPGRELSASLLYSSTACEHSYYFSVHGVCLGLLLGCWASSEHCERLDVLRTIAFLVPSISIAFLLLSISIAFLFPFLKCHLISRHHGEIYTTRSVQSRPPQFQQPQDRTEHRTHHVDFLTLGSMCLLIFIISTLTFRSRSC